MPQLGETVTEGTITRWLKKVGDHVALDEPLFEVSTDKVDSEVPSPVRRRPRRDHRSRGPDGRGRRAPRGHRRSAADVAAAAAPATRRPAGGPAAPAPAPAPAARTGSAARTPPVAPQAPPPVRGAGRADDVEEDGSRGALLSPVVRRLIRENGLDPAQIPGTGLGGRITRDDVLAHLGDGFERRRRRRPAPPASPAAPAPAAPAVQPMERPSVDARRRRSACGTRSCRSPPVRRVTRRAHGPFDRHLGAHARRDGDGLRERRARPQRR